MLRDLLPPSVRKLVYAVLGAIIGIEAIVDVVPAAIESKTLGILAVLGFTLAAGNVSEI